MDNLPDNKKKAAAKPWPLRYIVIAIVAFVLCFNLYLLLSQ